MRNRNQAILPYNDRRRSKATQIEHMFDRIAFRYDLLNRIMTLGIDKNWRLKAAICVKKHHPNALLDIATGTGDFAFQLARLMPTSNVIGVDFSSKMIKEASRKKSEIANSDNVDFAIADAENLKFKANTFDAVSCTFGVRNFEDLERGLSNMYRVLKPGGIGVILELSEPKNLAVKLFHELYFHRFVPVLGKVITGEGKAYSYLQKSVKHFPDKKRFVELLKKVGFTSVKAKSLSFGMCTMFCFYR